jgi:hypothetical protein
MKQLRLDGKASSRFELLTNGRQTIIIHSSHMTLAEALLACSNRIVASERHVHEFDPANPGLYAVPRDLAQRLKNVIIQTDGWRNKDNQWYEQLAALFGPANRDDVMVTYIPDQYFPTQIEGNSDSSGSSGDDESETSDHPDWYTPNDVGDQTSRLRELAGEVPYSSSDENDEAGEDPHAHPSDSISSTVSQGADESSARRRNMDRYIFKYVPDIAFHEGSDGDLDDSDLEEHQSRLT